MVRNPYMRAPNTNYRNTRYPPIPPKQEQHKKPNSVNSIFENASFSPQLSLLLSMILKDGFARNTTMELLKNIYPYVDPVDKAMIDRIFDIKEFAGSYRPSFNTSPFPGKALSKHERDLNLLRILKQYAAQDTLRIFDRIERSIIMQAEMSRMMHRLESFRNMKASTPDELINIMEDFMPPEERKNIHNITNMMQLFKNMGNFKPEDLMRMFGGMSK